MDSNLAGINVHWGLTLLSLAIAWATAYFSLRAGSRALNTPSLLLLPNWVLMGTLTVGLWLTWSVSVVSLNTALNWMPNPYWISLSWLAALLTASWLTWLMHRLNAGSKPARWLGLPVLSLAFCASQWIVIAAFDSREEWIFHPWLLGFSVLVAICTAWLWEFSLQQSHHHTQSQIHSLLLSLSMGITLVATSLFSVATVITLSPYSSGQPLYIKLGPNSVALYATIVLLLTTAAMLLWSASGRFPFVRRHTKNIFLATLLEKLDVASLFCDTEGKIILINQKMRDVLKANINQYHLSDNAAVHVYQDLLPAFKSKLEQTLKAGIGTSSQLEMTQGLAPSAYFKVTSQTLTDENGKMLGAVLLISDVSELHQAIKEQHQLLATPSILQLPQQAQLLSFIDQQRVKRGPQEYITLILLNIDDFKTIINTHGHRVANYLLASVSERLTDSITHWSNTLKPDENIFLGHLGGDQFAIALFGFQDHTINENYTNKLFAEFKLPFMFEGSAYYLRVSLGITREPLTTSNDALLKHAEMALYRSKHMGKHMVTVYSAEIQSFYDRQIRLKMDLSYALKNHQITLAYQPQVALDTQKLRGFEVLIRWQHPELGAISPDELIELAEKTDQITELDEWVLEHAIKQLTAWQQKKLIALDVKLAINISIRELGNPEFIPLMNRLLDQYGVPSCSLELELTETALLYPSEQVQTSIAWITKHGISLSLDDFGTGYSSLSRIKQFPLNMLKIDKAFSKHITEDILDVEICKTIIVLAKSLNIAVLAEGTETREQVDTLLKLGCEFGQGYYFAKPLNKDDATSYLTQHSTRTH